MEAALAVTSGYSSPAVKAAVVRAHFQSKQRVIGLVVRSRPKPIPFNWANLTNPTCHTNPTKHVGQVGRGILWVRPMAIGSPLVPISFRSVQYWFLVIR